MLPHSYPDPMRFVAPPEKHWPCGVARWSVYEPRTAVVFVHGFGGAATGTWLEFHHLLSDMPGAANADLLFYEYRSRQQRIEYNAAQFASFLEALVTQPFAR